MLNRYKIKDNKYKYYYKLKRKIYKLYKNLNLI